MDKSDLLTKYVKNIFYDILLKIRENVKNGGFNYPINMYQLVKKNSTAGIVCGITVVRLYGI